jgi:hypothetical protein
MRLERAENSVAERSPVQAKQTRLPSFGSTPKRSHFRHIQLKEKRSLAQVSLKKFDIDLTQAFASSFLI